MTRAALRRVAWPAVVFLLPTYAWAAWSLEPTVPPPFLAGLAGLVLYLGAHALRIVRMVVLLGDRGPSLRAIAAAHALTAPIGGQLPFKLGEGVRLVALGRAAGGLSDGVKAIWMERVFDAVLLATAAFATMGLRPSARQDAWLVGIAAVALIVATLVVVRTVPEALRNAKAFLIRRYTTDWSLVALRTLDAVGAWLADARRMVEGRAATLALLTLGLWVLEIGAFQLATSDTAEASLASALGLLSGALRPVGHPSPGPWPWLQLVGQSVVAVAGAWWIVHAQDPEAAP